MRKFISKGALVYFSIFIMILLISFVFAINKTNLAYAACDDACRNQCSVDVMNPCTVECYKKPESEWPSCVEDCNKKWKECLDNTCGCGGIGGSIFLKGCNANDPDKNSIECVVKNIINWATGIISSIIAIMIIISGIMYITSGGSVNQAATAKKTLVGAIAGLIIVITSYMMVQILIGLF